MLPPLHKIGRLCMMNFLRKNLPILFLKSEFFCIEKNSSQFANVKNNCYLCIQSYSNMEIDFENRRKSRKLQQFFENMFEICTYHHLR